jgi:hypothetical protein
MIYYNKVSKQLIGPLNSKDYVVIADRGQKLPPPINGLPEGVEVREADIVVYEKEK